jgi:hypothetical protein
LRRGPDPTAGNGPACVTLFRKALKVDTSRSFIRVARWIYTKKSGCSPYSPDHRIHPGFSSALGASSALSGTMTQLCSGSERRSAWLRRFTLDSACLEVPNRSAAPYIQTWSSARRRTFLALFRAEPFAAFLKGLCGEAGSGCRCGLGYGICATNARQRNAHRGSKGCP